MVHVSLFVSVKRGTKVETRTSVLGLVTVSLYSSSTVDNFTLSDTKSPTVHWKLLVDRLCLFSVIRFES